MIFPQMISAQSGSGEIVAVSEKAARVEIVIAKKFKGIAMKMVRARFESGDH